MKIETFGAFVELSGTKFQGLVHISQMAKDRVENVSEVVSVRDDVFVKVIKIEENVGGDGKSRISLSMKYCSQTDGTDRDPNGFEAETDEKRRKPKSNGKFLKKKKRILHNVIIISFLFIQILYTSMRFISIYSNRNFSIFFIAETLCSFSIFYSFIHLLKFIVFSFFVR